MEHLEEGTIHAWLDGALGDDQGREIDRHLADCPACSAAVAEARGLIAMASRVLTALDDVPGSVVPAGSSERPASGHDQLADLRARHRASAGRRRAWWRSPGVVAAAAMVFVAVGTTVVVRRAIWTDGRSAMEAVAPSPQAVADAAAPLSRDSIAVAAPPAPGAAARSEPASSAGAGKAAPSTRGPVAASSPAPTPVPLSRPDSAVIVTEQKAAVAAPMGRAVAREDSTSPRRAMEEDTRQRGQVAAASGAANAAVDARRKVADRLEASALRPAAPADVQARESATALPLAGCYAIQLVAVGGGPMTIAAIRLPTHVALDSTRVRDVAEVVYDARDVSPENERVPGTYRWRPTGTTTFELIVVRDGSTVRFAAASGEHPPGARRPATPTPAGAPVRLAATREACR